MMPRGAPTRFAKLACWAVALLLSAAVAERAEGQGRPRNFTATADGSTVIDLSWDAPTSGTTPTGYRLSVYDEPAGAYVLVATTDASTRTYRHTGLSATTVYAYRLVATTSSTSSSAVYADVGTPGATGTPGPPGSLSATADGTTAVDLSWTAPADVGSSAVTGYRIEVAVLGGGSQKVVVVANTGSTGTKYRHTGTFSGQRLYYYVSAINSSGAGTPTDRYLGVGTSSLPGSPSRLGARSNSQSVIRLSWSAASRSPTGYRILVSETGGLGTWSVLVANTGSADLTYEHTGLAGGSTRYYIVAGINAAGIGSSSPVASATTDPPGSRRPGPPTGLAAVLPTPTSRRHIDLSWTAPSDPGSSPITGYYIDRRRTSDVQNTGSTETTYRLGAAPGRTYTIRVAAINAVGRGEWSDTVRITTYASPPPGPPVLQGVLQHPGNRMLLSWTPSPSDTVNVVLWEMERRVTSSQRWDLYQRMSGATLSVIRGFSTGIVFRIRARGEGLEYGPWSNVVHGAWGGTYSPTRLRATADGQNAIDLSWSAPSNTGGNPVTGYLIEVSDDGRVTWDTLVANTGSAATSYEHTGLSPNRAYTYQVSAITSEGTGPPSNLASAATAPPAGVPGMPTGLGATASGDSAIDLAWTAPSDAGTSGVTGYRIEVSSDAGANWDDLEANTNSTATAYKHKGLRRGTTRHYRVRAVNVIGAGNPSNVANARTQGLSTPDPPRALSALGRSTSISLRWRNPEYAGSSAVTGYSIEVSADAGANWGVLVANYQDDLGTSMRWDHDNLPADTTLHYQVRAINGSGAGPPSNVAVGTTGGVPGQPTNLVATADGATAIALSWTAPGSAGASAISGYRIEVSVNAGASWTNLVLHTGSTGTAYRHTGLTAGETRHYRVRAINGSGVGPPSGVTSATTDAAAGAPGAPRSLGAASAGNTAIDLSWTAPASAGTSAITGYRIEVSVNAGGSWANLVANTGSTGTAYKHTGLAADTTLHYRVRAINGSGAGAPSNVASATTGAVTATVPGAPKALEAEAEGETEVELDWDRPDSDGGSAITGYRIEVSEDGGDWEDLEEDTESAATRYVHEGAEPGTEYRYRVRAINAVGEGPPSNVAETATEAGVPGAPTDLEAEADGPTEVDLDWEAPASDGGSAVTGYRIEVSEDGDDWDDLEGDTESTATRYVHRGARPGTRYWYRVRAINAVGEGAPSNRTHATTEASVSDAPTGLAATAVDEGRIDLEWTAPEFDGGSEITGYRIEVSYGSVNWEVLSENTESTATTYTHTGLSANTEATYRVAAVNENGHGPWSNLASARTAATVASAPRGLNARPVGTDRIDLDWTPPLDDGGSEIEGYRIMVAGPTGGFTALVNHTGTTATSYSDTGLEPGTRQRYRVEAINDAGVGPGSNVADARTDPVAPDAPVNVAARADGTSRIVVTWEAPGYTGGVPVTGYRIEVHDGSAWAVLVEDHGLSTTYVHGGLDPGDERRYRVYALNEAGAGKASGVAVAATDPVVPDPPTDLAARADGPHRIELEWRAPKYDGGAEITGYRIHVLGDGESEWRVLEEDTRTGETAYTHDGLAPATANRYRVAAVNRAGSSHLSAYAEARTDAVVPDPPENLRAGADGPYRIGLEWDAPGYTGGAPVTGYRIEAYDGRLWTVLEADTRSGAAGYSHEGLEPGSEWRYRVSAINEAGTGEPSEPASAVTDPVVPDPPFGLVAEADGPHRIRLGWMAPEYTGGAPITGYVIEGSWGDAVWEVVAETETPLAGWVHRGLEPASTWHYRVSAVNRAGAGEPSEMAVATTDPVRPDPPAGLRAEADGPYRIRLDWTAPSYTGGAPVTGYRVEVSEDGGGSWGMLVADTRSEATVYGHEGIRPGSTRHYRVSAINRAGVSDPSPVAFARTEATVPEAPVELVAVAVDHERVALTWTAPPFDGGSPVTGYRIEYSRDGGVSWEYVDENTQSGKTEHVHGGLRPATTYHYRVAAINGKGAGAVTEAVSVRTDATVPDAPAELVAVATTPREITLAWKAPEYDGGAPVTGYRIEVSEDGGGEWEVLDDTEGTEPEYVHGGLAPGETRHYRVRAANEAGTGAPSNVASAATDDPAERAGRVNAAILPRFASAVTAGIVEAVAARVEAVAAGVEDRVRAGNVMAARAGGLGAVLGGSGASRSFAGGLSTWLSAGSVTQAAMGGSAVRFEGGLFSAHAGTDKRLPRDLLAGLAVSRSGGAYDWTDVTDGREVEGTYEARLTSVTPYLAWTPGGGRASVWTAASHGRGSVEIEDGLAGARESAAALWTGAAGVAGRLLGGESGALNVRAEGWASWMGLEGADGIDAMDFRVRRLRAVVEWTRLGRFEGGHEAGLLVNGGGRYELNEGVDDVNGIEVGGGLRYASPARRLLVQGRGRLLLAVGGGHEEWGVGGNIQIDPGAGGGLAVGLNPSWGRAGSGVEALWSGGAARGPAGGLGGPGMEPGRAKFAVRTEYRFGSGAPARPPPGMPAGAVPAEPSLKPVPYARAELFGPARGLWLGARLRWLDLEGTYDRSGPALSARGAWRW